MKKTLNLLVVNLCLLVFITLACNLPLKEVESSSLFIEIQSIKISPDVAPAPFNGNVHVVTTHNKLDDTLVCYISADSGNVEVFRQTMTGSMDESWHEFSFSFTYNVPGSHDLVCLSEEGNNSWSANFTVKLTGTEEQSTEVQAGSFQNPRWGDFKTALLVVDLADAPYAWMLCWDPVVTADPFDLTVSPTGALSGTCEGTFGNTTDSTTTYQAVLTGQWDESSGAVSFEFNATSLEISKIGSGDFSHDYSIKGTGKFTTDNSASGSGEWSQVGSCNSPGCSAGQANGAMQWTISFSR